MTAITACIPYYNNKNTIRSVVDSIQSQQTSIREIIVWDDGSKESPKELLTFNNVHIKANSITKGRGFVRNALCREASNEIILFCDGTNRLPSNFVNIGITHFQNPMCAAVSGLIINDKSLQGTSIRWRGRHLFKEEFNFGETHQNVHNLTTYGTLIRRSVVLEVGNFNENLWHSEDKELGKRIVAAGYKIIGDPKLFAHSIKHDSWMSVLERYWRWYGGIDGKMNFLDYCHSIKASFKPMIIEDLLANDIPSALLSFVCPHYGYLTAKIRDTRKKIEK